ncbi:vitamin B12 dependent-methionine synthase activation domain-containing protein [Chloroflexota bacterium]
MHIRGENKHIREIVEELLEVTRPIARPKAVYEVSYVENRNQDSLDIGGIRFTGRLLRVNLDKIERVFPYVATCGREIDEIAVPTKDFMRSYCLDVIKETALRSAIGYLENYLKRNYALGRLSRMNPGSVTIWPITQQKELFSIFSNVEDLVGVTLTESYLMIPVKSVSGIFFPTEVKFESCQLCPREVCSGRRAPYDSNLVRSYTEDTK